MSKTRKKRESLFDRRRRVLIRNASKRSMHSIDSRRLLQPVATGTNGVEGGGKRNKRDMHRPTTARLRTFPGPPPPPWFIIISTKPVHRTVLELGDWHDCKAWQQPEGTSEEPPRSRNLFGEVRDRDRF
ncbi:hypothetical protein ZHAS_00019316 [Anopheles sinensis]|uniref:Uncharacterized protein n=1 Tax=Anopheles sinensis TaxID=74873 RepID=A0A084WLQ3_ANOSI|nr:hypothetical protein ZHAS_00019316 [Anopheles sinensis]